MPQFEIDRTLGHFFHACRWVLKEFERERKFCYFTKCLITYFRFTLKQIRKVIMFLGNKSISFCFLWKKISYSIVCLDVCVLISMHKYVNTNCRLVWFQFIGNNYTTNLRAYFVHMYSGRQNKTGLRSFRYERILGWIKSTWCVILTSFHRNSAVYL